MIEDFENFFKGKRILVTGGAGFVGSHLSEKLINLGANVRIIDNFSTGKLENISHILKKIELIEGDICDYSKISSAIKDCEYVFHEAYPYGNDGMGLDQQYLDTGLIGTYNILKASVICGIKKIINISSVSAYGIIKTPGLKEEMTGEHFLPYGITKLSGEYYCRVFSKTYGLDTVNLRYFYAYGERYATYDHSALVNFLDRAIKGEDLIIYGDGKQLRDYTYISDIVKGTILSLFGEGNGEVYNISGGGSCSILDLAKKVIHITGTKSKIKFAEGTYRYSDKYVNIPLGVTKKINNTDWIDERNYIANIDKSKKDFGYLPVVKLEEGIKKTWKWLIK